MEISIEEGFVIFFSFPFPFLKSVLGFYTSRFSTKILIFFI